MIDIQLPFIYNGFYRGKDKNSPIWVGTIALVDTLNNIWTWLSDPGNQKTLAFFGSGLGAVVAAAWAIFRYIRPSDRRALSTQIIKQHVEEGATAVIQTGEGQVYITKEISPEAFQRLSAELGITQAAVKNFFKILEQKDVPPEEYDSTFRRIAKTHKELEEKLRGFTSADPAVTALKEEAKEALVGGDLERTESLLFEAKERDIEAAKRVEKIAEERMLSAAASMAEIGDLKEIQLDYGEAASYYRQAVDLVPSGNDLILAKYLGQWGLVSITSGRYAEAENPLLQSLQIREKVLGPEHPDVATSMNNLAELYRSQGKYSEADLLYKRSLAIWEKVLGPKHPDVATSLNNLAELYRCRGKYSKAEPLYKRSLAIWEEILGPNHPKVAHSLNNLAELYRSQGKYSEADLLYKRSLAIFERILGPNHPWIATSLNNLALLYESQGKYSDAEPFYKRSLAICEEVLGPDHPNVATSLNNLAGLYSSQGKYSEADLIYKRSLAIREKVLGRDHPDVAISLNNVASLYYSQGKYSEAELLYKRALGIDEKALGKDHPNVATNLNNLAGLYHSQDKYSKAETLYKRSLKIREKLLGPEHPDVATVCHNMAELYKKIGKEDEAEKLEERARRIRSNQ